MKSVAQESINKWKQYGNRSPLCDFFNAICPISDEMAELINNSTSPISIAKGKFLIKPGSDDINLYLIMKGVMRGFIREDGKEITTWINEEKEIVGAIRNLGLKKISEEYVQALENTDLIVLPQSFIDEMYERFVEANIIGRILLEDNYRGAEERAYICRIPSAEKRYKRFLETQPTLLMRISLKYIASYLGITLETLSRVRSRKL